MNKVIKVDDSVVIPGKKLVPRLAVGCLVFAAVMGFGTFFIAQWISPFLKKRNDQYLQQKHITDEKMKPPASSMLDDSVSVGQ